ncbi:MFS transporter [Streptococcus merionis]|uniref:MFS transporter n=1 Tax=Streptococcus merionis TaxID=400065 RepID=UPI00351325ED
MRVFKNSYLAYLLMYMCYYLSWALFSSLISVYLLDLGYKASQVSAVVSTSFIASMLSQPLIGWLNDRMGIKKVTWLLLFLTIPGALLMIATQNLLLITLAYSWVLLLVNGSIPVMEKIATSSPFTYGKIRIWGTIGFALGSQFAGLIYERIAPYAVFLAFIISMLLTLLGIWGTEVDEDVQLAKTPQLSAPDSTRKALFHNQTYLFYLFIAMLFSGVTNAGHTYIPAMLEASGSTVQRVSSIVALAVLFETPLTLFSYKFMDQLSSSRLFKLTTLFVMLQFMIYALELGPMSNVMVTLLGKHTTGMLFIMLNMKIVSSLVDKRYLITALSLVQVFRSLGSILTQSVVGQIIDRWSYSAMCWFLAMVALIVYGLLHKISLPDGRNQNLFSKS